MRFLIAGGSASGIYSAFLLKSAFPSAEVHIFDKESKLGKKLYATGNGHCNIANVSLDPRAYNHPDFIRRVLKKYEVQDLIDLFGDLGVDMTQDGDLIYPTSFSAAAFVAVLEKNLQVLGVQVHLNERIIDYTAEEKISLKTDKGTYEGDYLFFATGGCSSPKLGSDGSLFSVFAKHGYKVEGLRPGLCAALTDGKTKVASGCRHDVLLEVVRGADVIYREEGEVLFRDNGLSGICVFNAVSAIERRRDDPSNYRIVLDFFPGREAEGLANWLKLFRHVGLISLLEGKMCDWVHARLSESASPNEIAAFLKKAAFRYMGPAGFEHSQVTIGGIALGELDESLQSRREKNVAFVGECVDIDGICGGYNLSWAALSALLATDAILDKFPSNLRFGNAFAH